MSGIDAMEQITGTKDSEIAAALVIAGVTAMTSCITIKGDDAKKGMVCLNVITQSLNDFKPRDAVEARLVIQATVAFEQAMSLTKRGTSSDMLCQLESLTNLAIKFMRAHNESIEALNRYRRGGEQKVSANQKF
jgi:hypothetical protein